VVLVVVVVPVLLLVFLAVFVGLTVFLVVVVALVVIIKDKRKAIPLQAVEGPEVSRSLRLPVLYTIGT
jgi:hypothetical protein